MNELAERLSKLEQTLSAPSFLHQDGLGNELAFFIFDFEPQFAPTVDEHIGRLKVKLEREWALRVLEINLFDIVLEILDARGYLERSFAVERERGNEAFVKAIAPLMQPERVRERIAELLEPLPDLILLTGVGQVWPLLRSHTVLNNLHELIDRTPLVMFFPGEYDGQELRLFGLLKDDNYYRAFPLLPRTTTPRSTP
jgi:Domain of unknown function (DUF1788)